MYYNIIGRIGYYLVVAAFVTRLIIVNVKKYASNRHKMNLKIVLEKVYLQYVRLSKFKKYTMNLISRRLKLTVRQIGSLSNKNTKMSKFMFDSLRSKGLLYARKHNLFIYTRISEVISNFKLLQDVKLLRLTKASPYGERKYKKFYLVGPNVQLALRGGNNMSSNNVHTIVISRGYISGSIQGVMCQRKLISIIETPGNPSDFGCFNNKALKFLTTKMAFVLKGFQKSIPKAIFFGANQGYISNYFHFMLDALPSLLCTMQVLRNKRTDWKDFVVLIPEDVNINIREIIVKCCEHYKFKFITLRPLQWISCKEVAMTGYPTYMKNPLPVDINYSVSPVLTRFTRKVLSNVFADYTYKCVPMNIYATRENALGTSSSRHVINYKNVSQALSDLDFKTINPAKMDLISQVKNFCMADTIVLDGGAAISNLLFSKSCKKVVILAMNQGTDPSLFVSLAQALNMKITYFCGKAVEAPLIPSWHLSYEIDVDLLKEYVYKLLASS